MFALEREIVLAGDTRIIKYAHGYRAVILTQGKTLPQMQERHSLEVPLDGELTLQAVEDSFITLMRYAP